MNREQFLESCLIDELNTGTAQQKLQYETGRMVGFWFGMFLGMAIGFSCSTLF
jgi:hypothetical protein